MRGWRHWPGECPGALQCGNLLQGIREWLLVPEHLQSLGTALIYIQIGCAFLGSLSKLYTGVPVAELAIALFALIAIESGIQVLLRIYLVLMGCNLLLDVSWFVLVANELRNIAPGKLSAMALYIFLGLQATSSIARMVSAFIWFPLIREGFSSHDVASYQPVNFDARLATLGEVPRSEPFWPDESQASQSETLAGSIYDPVYFSSLFEDTKDGEHQIILQR
ncbi:uncharacterized protein LOC9659012 isoform X2 [Selaginella moellendorffii]|uniref:uncharacterized protein LOC9659012 isoform X2 n=1 Tax=Selaginella moellendorffii TaxID=88036 RepID=UPI000D1C68B0|nr:uncharacterized protein LOC9659012 isoform X2 [Selaginella moellendorffii]|eukprot:XP_024516264.1 uncharacterized protein LOC9659012 isoform X2 [Selaginella moellendorffii]